MNEPCSFGGEEVPGRQLGLYHYGPPCRVTALLLQAGPTLAPCTRLPSTAGVNRVVTPGACTPYPVQESRSRAPRAPRAVNPSTISGHKSRIPWKEISNVAIDTPKVYHSNRWGVLIKLADRNVTWKM